MLMDKNNDTWVDQDEFKHGMNLILMILDLDEIHDETTVEAFYNLVFPEGDDSEMGFMGFSAQKTGLMSFIKSVMKRGLASYMSDNNIQ